MHTFDLAVCGAVQAVDIADAQSTVQRLEAESAAPAVWDNPGKAQTLMQSLAAARERCQEVQQLESLASDVQTALELAETEVLAHHTAL